MIATTLMRRNGNQGTWNPMEMFRRELENWPGSWRSEEYGVGNYPVDIHEDENFIYVEAELPGFKKNEIEVTLENGVLNIQAQRGTETKNKGESHLTERRFTRVARAFSLPNTVDESKVDANLADGLLTLKLHKREEVKPRKIEVK